MKIDIKDIKFWMDAIRNSEDRSRTLESFWGGQLESKTWLIENLEKRSRIANAHITIYGGWNGVLASMIFNSGLGVNSITSVDIDPICEPIASMMNKRQEMEGRFVAVTGDMANYTAMSDIVINTSCEHITQDQYNQWMHNQPDDALFVLQSNNYYECDEHINCSSSIDEFVKKSNLHPLWKGEKETQKYTRYMIIGKKHDSSNSNRYCKRSN